MSVTRATTARPLTALATEDTSSPRRGSGDCFKPSTATALKTLLSWQHKYTIRSRAARSAVCLNDGGGRNVMKAGALRIFRGGSPSIISTLTHFRRCPTHGFYVSCAIGYEVQRPSVTRLYYTYVGRGTRTVLFLLPIFGGYMFVRATVDWNS